jgi:hypothetical protein
VKRIAEIVESWVLEGTHFQSFIRYNPHGFTVNGVEQKVSQEKRLEKLFEILNDESHEIYNVEKPSEDHAHVLRHDNKVPVVAKDYGHLRECVLDCVYEV